MLDFLAGNDFLSAIVAFGLVLIPAVIIHELGHLLAAKAAGITVLEFGIGFPPRIVKLFRWGETDFTLNWIPLGGFVRPLGEDLVRPLGDEAVERDRQELESRLSTSEHPMISDVEASTKMSEEQRRELALFNSPKTKSVNEAKPLPRIFFMAAGALANFVSAFILFVFIALIGVPTIVGGRVHLVSVTPQSSLGQLGVESGDMIEAINGERFANSQDFLARLAGLKGENVILSLVRPSTEEIFDVQFIPTDETIPTTTEGYVRIIAITENSPAHLVGLLPDDLIFEFNGQSITTSTDPTTELQKLTEDHSGEPVTLTILRGTEEMKFDLVPRADPPPGEGRMGISIWPEYRSSAVGLVYTDGPEQRELVAQSLSNSMQYGMERTTGVLAMIAEVPGRIVRGTITAEEARPVSIVGISQMGGQALQQSIVENQPITIINYIAIISILLGLTNLLPLPALDGGRIVFVLIELVRGRPISPEREGLIHLIGLMFILSIGVFFILNDIINPLPSILP